jgi:hypothetical protein
VNNPHVIRSTYGSRGRTPITNPIVKPKPLGPEYSPWYWHPSRATSIGPPEWFRKQLHAFDPDLAVTWNPITQRWQVWARCPRFQTAVCQGWRLLFIHHGATRQYLPLDERVFARVYQVDATKNGGAKQYWNRIEAEFHRDEAKRQAALKQEAIDQAMPFWEYSQIKSIGTGSKFATYHA